MKHWKLAAVCAATSLLVACGGGSSGSGGIENPVDTRSMTAAGTAAKGRMANALVTVHAIRADGSVDDTALASTRTDSKGDYSLDFTGNLAQAHLVRVTAQADTTHVDEVTGAVQPLPAGFVMRSLIAAGVASASNAAVTPFSEMTIAAAEKLGSLSADNTQRAIVTMTQLLGFNPVAVSVKATSETGTTPEEQRQAVMLAAVSQLAATGGLGCSTGSAGEVASCVVDKLADAASADTMKLQIGGTDVSASFAGAVQTVLATPSLAGNVSAAVVTSALDNLQCSGSACLPTAPNRDAETVAGAIAAMKSLLTEIRSDWQTLFGVGATGTGDVGTQLTQFETAATSVQVPVEMLAKDVAALTVGIEYYNDFKAGRTTAPSVTRGFGQVTTAPGVFGDRPAVSCAAYSGNAFNVQATSQNDVTGVYCAAAYYVSTAGTYRHGFAIAPDTGNAGRFTYQAFANFRPQTGSSTNISSPAVSGVITSTADIQGRVRAFALDGSLPPAFESGTSTVIPGAFKVTMNATRTIDAADAKTSETLLSGKLEGLDTSGAVRSVLDIRAGLFTEQAGLLGPLKLDLAWAAGGSRFEGGFSTGAMVASKHGLSLVPSEVTLEGKLSNTIDGSMVEFLTGKFIAKVIGYETYDQSQPDSATNGYTIDLRAQGSASAPNRPTLQFSAGGSVRSHDDQAMLASLQYRSIVNGTPRMTVNASQSSDATGARITRISEVASGVSLSIDRALPTADVFSGKGEKIGVLDTRSGILTFVDGSFVSADLGQ